jgi:hypothetical protein
MAAPKQALISSSPKTWPGEWHIRVLVESAPDAIIEVDGDRRIILKDYAAGIRLVRTGLAHTRHPGTRRRKLSD